MTDSRKFHDGRHDGLVALESLDLDRVTSFADLLRGMSRTAFSGRSLGEAFEVMLAMVEDPDCKVVMTLSGAMTIAKMGKVISKMIDEGMVQAIVSTGALMAHGLSEAVGLVHYRHDPRMSDEELFEKGYNRVYDTLEMEANLNYVEEFSRRALDRLGDQVLSSEIVCRALGQVLAEDERGSGVLRSAYEKGVPVYVPAFTDSERCAVALTITDLSKTYPSGVRAFIIATLQHADSGALHLDGIGVLTCLTESIR